MSEFDLTISNVPGKANVIADALLCCADLDPTRVAAVSVSVESDLLSAIRITQEQDSSDTFSDLKFRALAIDRGICMHEGRVCHTSRTGGKTILIPDNKALK